MKRKLSWIIGCTLLCGLVASPIYAQKGVGESEGIARQAVKPDVVALSGTVKGIAIEKCEKTTGPSVNGAHILITSDDGDEWNIHLGPADDVRHITDKLVVGKELSVKAFRTDKLPSDNYVAQSLTIDDDTIKLRDEDLRPGWASGKRGGRGEGWGRGGNGPGWGGGRGPGWGNGPGRGGRGGQGGRGAGRGAGRGRGQATASNDETPLTDAEAEGLIRLREEEKLAHDVYVALRDKWDVPVFSNISQAESRHMDAMARLLDTYALTDPVAERETGEFDSPAFAKLYDQLVKAGSGSLADAYKVGALIEEMDIADLREAQEDSKRADILGVYANLERASRNHLRAFAAQLDRLDETYAAEHLKQAEFDAIAASDHERGGRGARGNGRGPGWGRGQGRGNAAGGRPGCGRCGQGGPGCGQCGQRGGGQGRGRGAGRGRGLGRGAGGGNG